MELLAIPSVSTDPDAAHHVSAAAEWLTTWLHKAGLDHIELLRAGGHPSVYADWLHAPGQPTVLIYGHDDTQPAYGEEGWSYPPFEPHVADGRVYARGAADMKGMLLLMLLPLEAMLATSKSLPVNVKLFLEGEEESGSRTLEAIVGRYRDLLAADFFVTADFSPYSENEPELCVGAEGARSHRSRCDWAGHGSPSPGGRVRWGAGVANPIHALSSVIAAMYDAEGRIAVDGFYDDVVELTPGEREGMAQVPFDAAAELERTGAPTLWGEPGFSAIERRWARPTLDVNGIWGGYAGPGVMNIIPSSAHAKLGCRLVPDQDPDRIGQALVEHVMRQAHAGVNIDARMLPGGCRAYVMPADHVAVHAADVVLTELFNRPPIYARLGGTLPFADVAKRLLGIEGLFMGFEMLDERQHAPGEFLRIHNFERGQRAYGRFFEELRA